MSNSATPNNLSDLFRQAAETYQSALKTGLKFQEETSQVVSDMVRDWSCPGEWQKKTQALVSDAIAVAQKNMEEAIRLMSQSATATMSMLQKSFEGPQQMASVNADAKNYEWWESALGAMRTNTEAVLQANARMLDSWTELAKKFNSEAVEAARSGASAMGGNHA
jgi:hypothetical protein